MKNGYGFPIRLKTVVIIFSLFGACFVEMKEEKEARLELKRLKSNLKSYNRRFEDNELLRGYRRTVSNIEKLLKTDFENKSFLSKILLETKKIAEDVERIRENDEKRYKTKLMEECLKEIRSKNFKSAVSKFYLIDDSTILESIISQAYNKTEKNFEILLDFVDAIPSIKLSFYMYETLANVLLENEQFTPEKRFALMKEIGKNVIFQYSVDHEVKSNATYFIDLLKNPVKDWVVKKLSNAISSEKVDHEILDIFDVISYKINDIKFLKEIAFDTFSGRVLSKRDISNFLYVVQTMKPVPKVILSLALYEEIVNSGVNYMTIRTLMDLQKNVENGLQRDEFSDFLIMPDLRNEVVKIFERALINNFYHIDETDKLSEAIFLHDLKFFKEVIEATVKKLHGKKDLVEMIKMFRGSTKIGQSTIGYKAVYDIMKKNGELTLISKNIGPLLKLESVVTETLGMPGLKYVEVDLATQLKSIQFPLVFIKEDVLKILVNEFKSGNYSNEEHKEIFRQIFAAETFQFFANMLADLYGTVNSERLMDYCMALPLIEERIVALRSVQYKISKNNDELFKIATYLKVIKNDKEYSKMAPDFKLAWEALVRRLPSPVRFSLFAKEVYIKSMKESEYLDLSPINGTRDLYTLKNGKKGRASKWILESTDEPNIFKIKNTFFDEYLYTSDKETRKVTSGKKLSNADWRMVLTSDGALIKNVANKEYLGPERKARNPKKRFVHTFPSLLGVWIIEGVFYDPI